MYKIERGKPVPKQRSWIKLFDKMEIGDSVFIAGQKDAGDSAGLSCRYYSKTRGKDFTCWKETGGVRIWRRA